MASRGQQKHITPAKPSRAAVIGIGCLILNLHCALVIALALYTTQSLAIVVSVLLGMAILIGGSLRFGFGMLYAGILAMALGAGGSMLAHDLNAALTGSVKENISILEHGKYPDHTILDFNDGRVAFELTGVRVEKRYDKSTTTYVSTSYYVAPVVTEDWSPGDPVTLWAAAVSDVPDSWSVPAGVGFAVNPLNQDTFLAAAYDVKRKHDLNCPDFRFVKWVESREEETESRTGLFVTFFLAVNIVWVGGMLVGLLLFKGE